MSAAKPFAIDKWQVYEAYQAVKANAGSAGVDKQSIEAFEEDLKGNLYKIWNRMSSGSYFPPPVKAPRELGLSVKVTGVNVRAEERLTEETLQFALPPELRKDLRRAVKH